MTAETKHPGGRPTDYSETALAIASAMYKMGAIDQEVADHLGVTVQTIHNWAAAHPEFFEARKAWKEFFDDRVEQALGHRAVGYSHPDTDIRVVEGEIVKTQIVKHYPPSEAAGIFWLKNRRRADWRDRIDHNVTGDLGKLSDEQVEERYQALMAAKAAKGEGK